MRALAPQNPFATGDAGAVDQTVQPAELLECRIDRGLRLGLAAHIDHHAPGIGAETADLPGQKVGIDIRQHHSGTG